MQYGINWYTKRDITTVINRKEYLPMLKLEEQTDEPEAVYFYGPVHVSQL